jgi:replicative DNA helicase
MTSVYKAFAEPEVEKQVLNHIASLSCTDVGDARIAMAKAGLMQEDFAVPLHRSVFNAVGRLVLNKGQAVDPFTVKAELESADGEALPDGVWPAVVDLTMGVGLLTSSSYESHCKILRGLAVRRMAVGQLEAAAAAARDLSQDPNVVIAQVTSKLASVAGANGNIKTLRQVMDELLERYEEVQSGEATPIIATGIKGLDRIIGGWQPTLNLLGALPGVGKSALLATTIQSIAGRGIKAGLISLEDEAAWLGYRLWSHEAEVDQFILRFQKTQDKEHERLGKGFTKMNGYWDNVIIGDCADQQHTIQSVEGIANNLILNHKCKVVFVDHIGEIARDSDDRYDLEVADHLSAMRRIANGHKVPVVVAMHLKRRDGLGPGDEPRLNDFANSAGSERKARVAVGLSRKPESDTLSYYVLKNTNGKSGKKGDVKFIGSAAMLDTKEVIEPEIRTRQAPPAPKPETKAQSIEEAKKYVEQMEAFEKWVDGKDDDNAG